MEIDYKTRINRIAYLLGQVIFIGITTFLSSKITCPLKKTFHIPCPFCGMTRSIKALLKLQIKKSIHYNILLIPILIILIITNIIVIIELKTNKKIIKKRITNKNLILTISITFILSIIWGIIHKI